MGKCTEGAPPAIARVLDVVTLCRLVNLWVELLLSPAKLEFRWLAGARGCIWPAIYGGAGNIPGVAVLAIVSCITVHGVAPLVGSLHRGAGCAPVLVLPRAASPVLVVVELGTRIPLPA